MINILLIGAGQIGSRHLQSLALLDIPATIDILDPSEQSRKTAEARFYEVQSSKTHLNLRFFESMTQVQKHYDIALITTDSKPRRSIIEVLVQQTTMKFLILEKFLFQQVIDYQVVESILQEKNIQTFVNTPRRQNDYYKSLIPLFHGSSNIHFRVSGADWGLGCNGIHFLDLFAMISGSQTILLKNNLIDEAIIDSKRAGYIEFSGTLSGYDSRLNSIEITSYLAGNTAVQIEISDKNNRIIINERTGEVLKSNESSNWKWEMDEFSAKYQSGLTHLVVKDLIENRKCDLPTYNESSHLHLLFLNTFLDFINKKTETQTDICPIT